MPRAPRHKPTLPDHKVCSRCTVEKPLSEFHAHKLTKDGRNSWCRVCHQLAVEAWQRANPERVRRNRNAWRRANRDKAGAYREAWRARNAEKVADYQRKHNERRREAARLRREANVGTRSLHLASEF